MSFHPGLYFLYLNVFIIMGCNSSNESYNQESQWTEKQITSGGKGHFINPVQAFSPDNNWIVYDTRNDGGHIGRTGSIERVNINTGKTETVYKTEMQTEFGPGVGAVAYHPIEDKVVFIHGIRNSDRDKPYDLTRRTGVMVDLTEPGEGVFIDARDVTEPFSSGALRGGTHAHSWSADGSWITFTYNDEVVAKAANADNGLKDLRLVGVSAPWGRVEIEPDKSGENNSGSMFSMLVTEVTENPRPGSDEIEKAYEDGWIGTNGYVKSNGTRQKRAIAFLGDVISEKGEKVTEVFVVDVPDEYKDLESQQQLKGTSQSRPLPLDGISQRRVTYSTNRKFPGVQGPRQWMKSTPDGTLLFFMMKDNDGSIQIYSVPTIGGDIKQITNNSFSIETSFDIDGKGKRITYGAQGRIYITSIDTGVTKCVLENVDNKYSELHSVQWSRNGEIIAYNRKVAQGDTSYFQIFTLAK